MGAELGDGHNAHFVDTKKTNTLMYFVDAKCRFPQLEYLTCADKIHVNFVSVQKKNSILFATFYFRHVPAAVSVGGSMCIFSIKRRLERELQHLNVIGRALEQ